MAFLHDFNQPAAAAARFALGKPEKLQTEKTGIAYLFRLEHGEKNTFPAKAFVKKQTKAQRKRIRFGEEDQGSGTKNPYLQGVGFCVERTLL